MMMMRVREAKEYPWGKFTLWVYPQDELTPMKDADTYKLVVPEKRDPAADAHGHRTRWGMYWRPDFHVRIPASDLAAD